MKVVKFRDYLVPLILTGEKNSTWRVFDDKNLSLGDEIELMEFGAQQPFARAVITQVIEKPFAELTPEDKQGHETFKNDAEIYRTFSGYYQQPVGPDTPVKLIWFKLQ